MARRPRATTGLEPHVPEVQRARLRAFVTEPRQVDFRPYFPDLKGLTPELGEWLLPCSEKDKGKTHQPPEEEPTPQRPSTAVRRNRYGDSGLLENSTIPSVLAYSDVERMIAFVNSDTRLRRIRRETSGGTEDASLGTEIEVDWMIPPLFGYYPFDRRRGYQPFGDKDDDRRLYPDPFVGDLLYRQFRHNQVFASNQLSELLEGLWASRQIGGREHTGILYRQELRVEDNPWFGIRGGRSVTVLWVYLDFVEGWYERLRPEVQTVVSRLRGRSSIPHRFPWGDTFETGGMSPTQVNLLSNMAAWVVACEDNRNLFLEMFDS